MGKPAQTPAVERSSEEETVTEGLLPAVLRSSEEETATVHDDDGQDPRTPDPDGTRDQRTPASDGRLVTVLRTTRNGRSPRCASWLSQRIVRLEYIHRSSWQGDLVLIEP